MLLLHMNARGAAVGSARYAQRKLSISIPPPSVPCICTSRGTSPREVHLEYSEDDRDGVNHDKASHNPVGRSVLVDLWPRGRWVREVGQKRVQAKKEQADRQKAMHRIFYTESR